LTVPWGFRKLLNYISQNYTKPLGIPIWITENGFATENESKLSFDQIIDDKQRQNYYAGYLGAMFDAIREDGVNIGGYMGWSLLEWVVSSLCLHITPSKGHEGS
jgi:beta-glucosidase